MELGKILNLCLVILGLGIISRYLIGEKLKRGEKPLGSFKMSLSSLKCLFKPKISLCDSPLKVLGEVRFGLRERLLLLGFGSKRFLVAFHKGEIHLLGTFEEEAFPERKKETETQEEQNEIKAIFPFPLEEEEEIKLRPLSEVLKRVKRDFPFLLEAEKEHSQ
jgi:flagellar biogenesis protein FliO